MLFTNFSDLRICDGLSGLYMIDVECKSARASKAFAFFACSALFSVHFKIPELSDAKFFDSTCRFSLSVQCLFTTLIDSYSVRVLSLGLLRDS